MHQNNGGFYLGAIGIIFLLLAYNLYIGMQLDVVTSVYSKQQKQSEALAPIFGKAESARKNLEKFLADLQELSKTDKNARVLVERYKIRQVGNRMMAVEKKTQDFPFEVRREVSP